MTQVRFDTRNLTWRTVAIAVLRGNYFAMLEQEHNDPALTEPLTLLERAISLLQRDTLLPDPLPQEPQEARQDG